MVGNVAVIAVFVVEYEGACDGFLEAFVVLKHAYFVEALVGMMNVCSLEACALGNVELVEELLDCASQTVVLVEQATASVTATFVGQKLV